MLKQTYQLVFIVLYTQITQLKYIYKGNEKQKSGGEKAKVSLLCNQEINGPLFHSFFSLDFWVVNPYLEMMLFL